jgi:hypothetical protein
MSLMLEPSPLQQQQRKKRFTFKNILLVTALAGTFLGICGSLVEASMKDPFRLAFDIWGTYRSQVPEQVSKSFSMFWFGITNFKLYYFFVGLLLLIFTTSLAVLTLGIVGGAFIGGAFYWILSIAQP